MSFQIHIYFEELLEDNEGVALFSGTVFGLFGKLFIKENLVKYMTYIKIKSNYNDRFYLEIQRHKDQNELGFEKFNLKKSLELEIPYNWLHMKFFIS